MNLLQLALSGASQLSAWILGHPLVQLLLPLLTPVFLRRMARFLPGNALPALMQAQQRSFPAAADSPPLLMDVESPPQGDPDPTPDYPIPFKEKKPSTEVLLSIALLLMTVLLAVAEVHLHGILQRSCMLIAGISAITSVGWVHLRWVRMPAAPSLQQVDLMTGAAFEQFLVALFRKFGYRVRHTGRVGGDYGGDLLVERAGKTCVVQAKRYLGHVGVAAVQEVLGARGYYAAASALVVTNSSFTDQARILAGANGVALWDRSTLWQMMQQVERTHTMQLGAMFLDGTALILHFLGMLLCAVLREIVPPKSRSMRHRPSS